MRHPPLSTTLASSTKKCRKEEWPGPHATMRRFFSAREAGFGVRPVCAGPAVPVALAQEITPCAALAGRSIEPALIGLPGGPARIASAAMERLPASQGAESSISYCKVLGEIAPLDPAAPPIRFEVNLPEQWNGKAVQYGGGGFNGVLITGLDPLRDARFDTPVPVARGYATWGTDSGHDSAKLPEIQAFALNAEALETMPLRPTRRCAMRRLRLRVPIMA
jgi:hypothetical protein